MRKLLRTIAGWSIRTCAGCALLFAVQGHAFSLDERGRVSLNVFGTLGAVYNSDENVEFVRDYIQPDGPKGEWSLEPDTVLGAQLSIRPVPEWEAVLQVISRHNTNGVTTPA